MVALNAAIAAIWKRSQPATEAKVQVLTAAAERLRSGQPLLVDERTEALSVAHKLAGSAGMFGFMNITDLSRSLETMLHAEALDAPTFVSTVAELQAAVQQAFSTSAE